MERKHIADFNTNDQAVLALVVLTATARETRQKKPYLQLEFFDGIDKISGNYWDWASGIIPEKNSVLYVTCQFTEWQGTKQLNVSKMNSCTDFFLADFMPQSGINAEHIYEVTMAFINDQIEDADLHRITSEAFIQLANRWKEAPGAITVHHAYAAGTLIHSLETARIALSIASAIDEANCDLVVAAALLHDLGKLFTYKVNGIAIEYTDEGHLFEHTFIGADFISNFADHVTDPDDSGVRAKVSLLMHCILAHHGKCEYGATVPPVCLEAHIVSHADSLSAAAEIIRKAKPAGNMWTERIWALENKPHVQPSYTEKIFEYIGAAPPDNEFNLQGQVE